MSAAAAAKSLQSCPTLCDPIDGSPLGSPVHGIFQARVLEWVAIAFSVNQLYFNNFFKEKKKRYIYPNVHCSNIYNSQDMEEI